MPLNTQLLTKCPVASSVRTSTQLPTGAVVATPSAAVLTVDMAAATPQWAMALDVDMAPPSHLTTEDIGHLTSINQLLTTRTVQCVLRNQT